MADATNEVRLWRNRGGWWVGDPGHYRIDRETWLREMGTEYIARPRADDDAREERLKAAEAAARVCREDAEANATRAERAEAATMAATRDRDEWKARAERAEARFKAMEQQYENAMDAIHRNAGARRDGLCGILAWIDTVKAERDSARALLKEARPHVQHSIDEGAETGIELLARIDAETRGEDGPTNDRNHDAAAASGAAGTDPKEP